MVVVGSACVESRLFIVIEKRKSLCPYDMPNVTVRGNVMVLVVGHCDENRFHSFARPK